MVRDYNSKNSVRKRNTTSESKNNIKNFDVKSFYTQYTEAAAAASGAAAESSETESAGDSADTAGESAK